MDWLTLSVSRAKLLQAPPAGDLRVTTIRKDGAELAADAAAPRLDL